MKVWLRTVIIYFRYQVFIVNLNINKYKLQTAVRLQYTLTYNNAPGQIRESWIRHITMHIYLVYFFLNNYALLIYLALGNRKENFLLSKPILYVTGSVGIQTGLESRQDSQGMVQFWNPVKIVKVQYKCGNPGEIVTVRYKCGILAS